MSKEHVSTWTASVYTVQVTMFPRGFVCVYIVHVVKPTICNYCSQRCGYVILEIGLKTYLFKLDADNCV